MSNKTADVLKKATELEPKLKGKLFLEGAKPTAADVKAFNDLLGANPNLFRWVKHMASFTEKERSEWGAPLKAPTPVPAKTLAAAAPAKKAEAPKAAAPAKAAPKKPEPAPKAAAADDDDDVDLFGEETEEEKAALEAKKQADADAKKAKKTVIAKSSILLDIKPWDDTTDLNELAKMILAVERDGLLWGAQKMVPVAYGVKKLQQLLVIEDDKVSGEDLEDIIQGFEDHVQSMDIVAWNKV